VKAWPGEGVRTIGNKFCRQSPKVVQAMGGGAEAYEGNSPSGGKFGVEAPRGIGGRNCLNQTSGLTSPLGEAVGGVRFLG
jgi:hypothetical protein